MSAIAMSTPLEEAQAGVLRSLLAAHTLERIAERLALGEVTVLRAAAGLPVHRATRTVIVAALTRELSGGQ